jgi:exopolysaccharide biosynthesis polyprenyl glycosylphosphotransferase
MPVSELGTPMSAVPVEGPIEQGLSLGRPPADIAVDPPPGRDHSPDTARVVMSAGQAVVVALAVLVPTTLTGPPAGSSELLPALVLAAAWVVTLRAAFGAGRRVLGVWPSAVFGTSAGLVAVIVLNPMLPGRQFATAELIVVAAGVLVSAAAWERVVRHTEGGRRRVLVVGTDELSDTLAAELEQAGVKDFDLIGRVSETTAADMGCRVPLAGELAELASVVEAQHPDLILLTDEHTYGQALDRLLDGPGTRARVVGLAGFFEYALGRVPVRQLSPAWFMSVVHLRQRAYGRLTKRAFDVVAAVIGLLLALPAMAAIALFVARTRGPILYRQTRLGEGGEPFTVFKFRTMAVDAERGGCAHFTCENDPRVIPGGRVLRRTHLDELPQLWNVLTGDMSVVGPRPERPEFAQRLEEAVPFWNRRLLVKPGVTGWAQIQCGYVADCDEMADKLAYDLWYLRNRSLALDVVICMKTIGLQFRALLPSAAATAKGIGR